MYLQTIAYYLLIHKQMELKISKINNINYNKLFMSK